MLHWIEVLKQKRSKLVTERDAHLAISKLSADDPLAGIKWIAKGTEYNTKIEMLTEIINMLDDSYNEEGVEDGTE